MENFLDGASMIPACDPLTLLGFTLLLWLPQNTQHEGIHCIAHKLYGAEITDFHPLPSTNDGRFRFAYMSYRYSEDRRTDFQKGLCSAAPQLTNTAILLVLCFLTGFLQDLPVLAVAWAITNYLDGAVNLATVYRLEPKTTTDGWRTVQNWKINVWFARALVALWHIGFGAMLLLSQ